MPDTAILETGSEGNAPLDPLDALSSLMWSPEGEDPGVVDEASTEVSDADMASLTELFGDNLTAGTEGGDEQKGQAAETEAKPEGGGGDVEADTSAADEKSLGMPSIPAFQISDEEFDEAMTDSGKFTAIMTRYGEAVAAQTMRHVLTSMGPHVFNIAVGAFDNLSKAQKMFDSNPEFEEHPEAFGKALIAERRANPNGSYADILKGVEKRMRSALELRDKVTRHGGRRVDARGGAGRVNAPGTGTRSTSGTGEESDPTFAAFNSIMKRR